MTNFDYSACSFVIKQSASPKMFTTESLFTIQWLFFGDSIIQNNELYLNLGQHDINIVGTFYHPYTKGFFLES